MPDVRDVFYHGMLQQVKRVLDAMGEERIDMGLTAFEDGASNWSSCFFARAYPELNLHRQPEFQIAEALGMGKNRVPMRIVYHLFDGVSSLITKERLRDIIVELRDEKRPQEVMDLLRSIDMESKVNTEVDFACPA